MAGGGAQAAWGRRYTRFAARSYGVAAEIVTDALHLEACLADADYHREGRIDSQTIHGKVPIGVATSPNGITSR
ncbi:glycerate kinase [Salmonella enterica subsp. enterica serovar Weltevreden]|nr:glycerate kinase [Salmonella enterica subsp. enterica serovar Weltevreden]